MPLLGMLFALLATLIFVQGKTLERDGACQAGRRDGYSVIAVVALLLFKQEVINRDPYWRGIVESWTGGGPNGEDDPCGAK